MAYEYDPHVIRAEVFFDHHTGIQLSSLQSPVDDSSHVGGNGKDYTATARVHKVKPEHYLGYLSTTALTFNRTIGTAIFVNPAIILGINGSKTMCIILWLIGGVITWAGMTVYLEYGIRWPLNGGELHYIDRVWTRPRKFWPYFYGIMFIILGGSQGNAIIFGQAVLTAASPGSPQDPRLVKAFAIFLVASVCLFQTFSRMNYIRFSNVFAIYKVVLLTFITIVGWLALGNVRSPVGMPGPFGLTNLANDITASTYTAYGVAVSLLLIMRAYAGYEVVNYVLEEIKRPPMDRNRVYRWSLKLNIASITFFYIMVNVAFFATCSTDEILAAPDTLALFFSKVFGNTTNSRIASGVVLCLSAGGNMMSFVYTNVRVKQEIARMGIIPIPEFWANTSLYNTPGPSLLLHFLGTGIFILAAPLGDTNGFLVFSTLPNYARTIISIILGLRLLAAPWLRSFQRCSGDHSTSMIKWKPQSARLLKGFLVFPLTVLFIVINLFVLILYWFPAQVHQQGRLTTPVVSNYVGPVVAMSIYGVAILYWLWDWVTLPNLGYRMVIVDSDVPSGDNNLDVRITFKRDISGISKTVVDALTPIGSFAKQVWVHGFRKHPD